MEKAKELLTKYWWVLVAGVVLWMTMGKKPKVRRRRRRKMRTYKRRRAMGMSRRRSLMPRRRRY